MATKTVYLETRKLDREFAQPFVVEVNLNDIIEFKPVDDTFTVSISNLDDFLMNEDGTDAGDHLNETINVGNSKKWKVGGGPFASSHKYYDVCWDELKIYADRPGASPPRIIITG